MSILQGRLLLFAKYNLQLSRGLGSRVVLSINSLDSLPRHGARAKESCGLQLFFLSIDGLFHRQFEGIQQAYNRE